MSDSELVEVYRARDSQQAHLLRAALEDRGIRALVEGDLLQGALGGVPVGWSSAPRLLVQAEDAGLAQQLIAEWEQRDPPDAEEP